MDDFFHGQLALLRYLSLNPTAIWLCVCSLALGIRDAADRWGIGASSTAEVLEGVGGLWVTSGREPLFTDFQADFDEEQVGQHGERDMVMPASP
jgi:hypothetical protein